MASCVFTGSEIGQTRRFPCRQTIQRTKLCDLSREQKRVNIAQEEMNWGVGPFVRFASGRNFLVGE